MSSSSFLVACHLQTVDTSTPFPIWISFSSDATARTSKTMLSNSGESGHPYLVPNPSRNAFSISLLSMMLAVGLSYMVFIMLR